MKDYFLNFEKYAYVKGPKPEGCILCLIRDRDPAVIDLSVYRGELFLVTVNLYPYNPGHLLIFPQRHIVDVRSFSREEEQRLNELTRYFLDIADKVHPAGGQTGLGGGTQRNGATDPGSCESGSLLKCYQLTEKLLEIHNQIRHHSEQTRESLILTFEIVKRLQR